jgi:hypothetical protein
LKLSFEFSKALKLLSIIFTLPNTTASNKILFSSLKRVKSFLRLTISDDNDLMVIKVKLDTTHNLEIDETVNKFVKMMMRQYFLKY